MSNRTVSRPSIHIDHPRAPEPSKATLYVRLDWIKSDELAACPMTEGDLYDLAEECLKVASILRRNQTERERGS